ncbi:MAG: UvrD-helicase domain-containing protein [Motiliproteus sp.]
MTTNPADYLQRQQCLQADQSFSVRAPAGSGKTELLTQRVLVLLAAVQKPEEILCITFTRKAAAEMLDRILKSLKDAEDPQQPESEYKLQSWQLARTVLERDQQLGWNLRENPSRLRILTIDGLCARLTKSLPALSQFGAQPEIAKDPHSLYQLAVQRLLDQLETEDNVAIALSNLLKHLDNRIDQVESLLISMLARRDQWLNFIGTGASIRQARGLLEQGLDRLLEEELGQLGSVLAADTSALVGLADYAASNLEAEDTLSPIRHCLGMVDIPDNSAAGLIQWRGLSELLLKKDGDWRVKVDKRCGFIAGVDKQQKLLAKQWKEQFSELVAHLGEDASLKERLNRVRILPEDRYSDRQWELLESLTILLPNLVAQLMLCFMEKGAVDYPQMTSAALTALGDDDSPTDLSLILDYQIRHILVDEFQDTATPQIRLLEKLTYGWEPGDGRTLFIVGDGMQSCYGFRDANVGLFLDARKHGIGAVAMKKADLSVNFRSQQGVVAWVNQTFEGAFPGADDISRGAVSYEQSEAFNGALDGKAVSVDIFVDHSDRQAEANHVAKLVRQALADSSDKSVAILVRNRSHLKLILPGLREAGLRWKATDLDALTSRMWVVDLISLLKAILNPANRIAWLAILRAPWCGLSNQDLLAIAGGEGQNTNIWSRLQQYQQLALSTDGHDRLSRLVGAVSNVWAQRARKPLRIELESLWTALGGPATIESESQLQDINQVFALVELHDQGCRLADEEQFQRDLDKLFAAPDSEGDPRLQVMTIHKSKGLEFDTVILAGLDRSPRADDKQLLLWQRRLNDDGREDLLLGPLAATGDEQDPLYQYIKQEQSLKNQMEGTRLLYVGATRAVDHLHLVAHLKTDSRTCNPRPPAQQSLLASIWPYISEDAMLHTRSDIVDDTEQGQVLTQLRRLPDSFQLPQLSNGNLLGDHNRFTKSDDDTNLPQQNWLDSPRHIGTLVHRLLRQMVINPKAMCEPSLYPQFYPAWSRQLQQLGVPYLECKNGVSQIDKLLRNILQDTRGRWVIDGSHQQSACELAISHFNGFQSQQLIVDRTFIDSEGSRWIIDYKTSSAADDQPFAEFVAQEVERYRRQLALYANAISAMETNPVRTALYFPESCHFEEVDLEQG